MKRHMNILLGSLLAVFILTIAAVSVHESASAKTDLKQRSIDCTSAITKKNEVYPGYASPISGLDSSDVLLSIKGCDKDSITVHAGDGDEDTYIYPTGHVWDGKTWKKVSFKKAGDHKNDGEWIVGKAEATLPSMSDPWVAAYVCEKTADGDWDCGCRGNTLCATDRLWSLQHVDRIESVHETWVLGYYDPSGFRIVEPEDLPWQHITHIALGDTTVASWGGLDVTFPIKNSRIKELWGYNELNDTVKEATKNDVVPLIRFGGGAALTDEWRVMLSEDKIENTVNDVYENMDEHNLAGIDINWTELSDDDLVALLDFVTKLKMKNADTIVTVGLPYLTKDDAANEFYVDIAKLADRVNLMQHLDDEVLLEHDESSHYSPLKIENGALFSIENTLETYVEAGIDKQKVNIEIPYHGQCWDNVDGAYASIQRDTTINALVPIEEIINDYPSSRGGTRDRMANVSYLQFDDDEGTDNCMFISYVDRQDAIERAEWVLEENVGGVVVWDLAEEVMNNTRNNHYMTEAIYRELSEK